MNLTKEKANKYLAEILDSKFTFNDRWYISSLEFQSIITDWLKFHTILAEAKKVCYCKATTSKKRHEPRCPAGVIKNIIDKYKDD